MVTASKVARVERPSEIHLGEFLGDMRKWLDHQCIMPANFTPVTLANKSGVFDALFDNPRGTLGCSGDASLLNDGGQALRPTLE